MESVKNLIKGIIIFVVGGAIMFEALILIALISIKNDEEKKQEEPRIRFNIYSVTMQEIPVTDENKAVFSYYDESEFKGKIILELEVNIDNAGEVDINPYYDLSYFTIKDAEEYFIQSQYVGYYKNDEYSNYGRLTKIPAGKSGIVTYYLLVDEDKYIDELHIHTGYDEGKYIEVVF